MTAKLEESFQAPGDVIIKQLELVSPGGRVVDLKEFLVELNLYESLFSPTISGSLILSDSRNLIKTLPILGEELLCVDLKTPTFEDSISIKKVFRVYAIKDKVYSGDGSALLYKLNFSSVELFRDISNPIFRSFSGNPSDIITSIFNEYLSCSRYLNTKDLTESAEVTPLLILNNPENTVKFVSPGWSPIQCINWLCSKSLLKKASNFLFWETTKGFFYGSTDIIYSSRNKVNIGNYIYSSSFASNLDRNDLNKRLQTIKTLSVEKSIDQLSSNLSGHIASRLIDINLYNKTYKNIDYYHGVNYFNYSHTFGESSFPLFYVKTSSNPESYQKINYNYPNTYDDAVDNFSEVEQYIFSNRRSNMLEIDNFNMKIGIPGRTDIEVGNLIYIDLPKVNPTFTEERASKQIDEMYSGYYLIKSLNHKINRLTHFITCEVSKDSIPRETYNGSYE